MAKQYRKDRQDSPRSGRRVDPKLIRRYQRRFPGFDEKIGSMYARGGVVQNFRVFVRRRLRLASSAADRVVACSCSISRTRRSSNLAQPCCRQVEARLTIRKGSDHTCAAPDLFHDPLERIVGPDLMPVDVGGGIIGQRFIPLCPTTSAALFILAARKTSMIDCAFRSAAARLSCA